MKIAQVEQCASDLEVRGRRRVSREDREAAEEEEKTSEKVGLQKAREVL